MKKSRGNWLEQGQSCLQTALARLEELAADCADTKQLKEIVDTVGELVITGETLAKNAAPTEEE